MPGLLNATTVTVKHPSSLRMIRLKLHHAVPGRFLRIQRKTWAWLMSDNFSDTTNTSFGVLRRLHSTFRQVSKRGWRCKFYFIKQRSGKIVFRVQHFSLLFILLVGAADFSDQAGAQPTPEKKASSTHIFPAGGRRGTKVNVRVGAECSPPRAEFIITANGLSTTQVLMKELPPLGEPSPRRLPTEVPISYPREWAAEVSIAEDTPPGPVYWRLSTALGGTTSRPFIVGELPELVETESNSTADAAEPVTLPVTINGQIYGERDADYFRFQLKAGESVSCEVLAGRIGSRLDPLVELLNADGSPAVAQQIHLGSDPLLVYRANVGGEYLLRVANVTFHGSPAHVYRINLTNQPRVYFAFPGGGLAGTSQDIELHLLTDTESDPLPRTIDFPAEPGPFVYRDPELGGEILLVADISPNSAEREPNDDLTGAMNIALPQTINGRFQTITDEDWFQFEAEQNQQLQITCRAFPPGTPALPNIVVTDASGKPLAESRSVSSDDGICQIKWTAPETGSFCVRARDLRFGSRAGPDFLYRLSVAAALPDFSLSVASDNIDIVPGEKTQVDVSVQRFGGFNGSIDLEFDNLPQGLKLNNAQVPANAGSVKLELDATEDVLLSTSPIRLMGRALIDERTVERFARGKHLGVDSEGVSIGPTTIEQLHLTISHKPLFRLFCSEAYQYAHRGSVYPYPMEIERLNDFTGAINVQSGDRQNRDLDGVQIWNAVIGPDDTKVDVPIYMPESMHINVQAQSQLYSQAFVHFKDSHGREQSMLLVAEKRNMMRTLPPVVKLQAVDQEVTAKCGDTVQCRLHLERTSNFPGPMSVELLGSDNTFVVEPFKIPGGKSDVQVAIRVPLESEPGSLIPLVFRGQGQLNDRIKIITEASVAVRVE